MLNSILTSCIPLHWTNNRRVKKVFLPSRGGPFITCFLTLRRRRKSFHTHRRLQQSSSVKHAQNNTKLKSAPLILTLVYVLFYFFWTFRLSGCIECGTTSVKITAQIKSSSWALTARAEPDVCAGVGLSGQLVSGGLLLAVGGRTVGLISPPAALRQTQRENTPHSFS